MAAQSAHRPRNSSAYSDPVGIYALYICISVNVCVRVVDVVKMSI